MDVQKLKSQQVKIVMKANRKMILKSIFDTDYFIIMVKTIFMSGFLEF